MKKKNNQPSPLVARLKQMVISSRPISWINTAFPFAAGYLFTGGPLGTFFVVATLYFLIPYNFLIYIVNDVFDYESDMRNPRKNSIEGGLLPPETHRFMLVVTGLFNAVFLAWLLANGTAQTNIMLLAIVFGALAYSVPILRFKERPVIDSLTSSFHFVSPLVFGLLITGWNLQYVSYILAFYLWGCASHAFGAVQDINSDREANISSIATWLGAKRTVRLSLVFYVVAALTLALCGWPAIIVGLPVLAYAGVIYPFGNLKDSEAEKANKGWRHFLLLNQVTGFVITILLILSAI